MRSHKIRSAGLLLGIGLGGFLDGIVLHEFLYDTLRLGLWLATLAGVIVLWSALRGPGPLPRDRSLAGWALVGWGAFNLAEGMVNQLVLALHEVRDLPGYVPAYDWLFLLIGGVGLVALGYAVKASKEEPVVERRSGLDRRSASPLR
jgi:uncharacterized membrane protein